MEKVCNRCNTLKGLEEFNKNRSRRDGYSGSCKTCNSLYLKKHYLENKNYYISRNLKVLEENREYVAEILSNTSCKYCSVKDIRVLEFHHRDPTEKYKTVSELLNGTRPKLDKEIAKCDILCANCHKIITHEQQETYKHKFYK